MPDPEKNSAYTLNRLMSSFLRMIGGRFKWATGKLLLRTEDDSNYADIGVAQVDATSLALRGANSVTLTANPNSSYSVELPKAPGDPDQVLTQTAPGQLGWTTISEIVVGSQIDRFYPIFNNQTVFLLSHATTSPADVILTVNGVEYKLNLDFTSTSTSITWISTAFQLETTDWMELKYPV